MGSVQPLAFIDMIIGGFKAHYSLCGGRRAAMNSE